MTSWWVRKDGWVGKRWRTWVWIVSPFQHPWKQEPLLLLHPDIATPWHLGTSSPVHSGTLTLSYPSTPLFLHQDTSMNAMLHQHVYIPAILHAAISGPRHLNTPALLHLCTSKFWHLFSLPTGTLAHKCAIWHPCTLPHSDSCILSLSHSYPMTLSYNCDITQSLSSSRTIVEFMYRSTPPLSYSTILVDSHLGILTLWHPLTPQLAYSYTLVTLCFS